MSASPDPRLEPDTAALLRKIMEGQSPPADQTMAEQRAAYAAFSLDMAGSGAAVARRTDRTVEGPVGAIAVRLYEPDRASDGALVVYIHGGGFIFGDLETHDAICRLLANKARARVLAIAYRRAPEHPFPAARDDCFAVVEAVLADPAAFGARAGRIAVAGESAGAALAAAVAIRLKRRLTAMLLLVPALDSACSTPSAIEFASGYGPSAEEFRLLWSQYEPDPARRRDPEVSPFYATDLAGVAETFVHTAECDPSRDEGERFADALERCGVRVHRTREPGLVHYFPNMLATSSAAKRAMTTAARALGDHLATILIEEPS